jgi:hypothetical protein
MPGLIFSILGDTGFFNSGSGLIVLEKNLQQQPGLIQLSLWLY